MTNKESNYAVNGSCLCGEVNYQISGNIGIFQNCHCSRCRKFTGSNYASNLMTSIEQFSWTKGEEFVNKYAPTETKYFTTAFCMQCGSSLPWLSKNSKVMIIPIGTLDEDPQIKPSQNVFCASQAKWYTPASDLPNYDALPERKS